MKSFQMKLKIVTSCYIHDGVKLLKRKTKYFLEHLRGFPLEIPSGNILWFVSMVYCV